MAPVIETLFNQRYGYPLYYQIGLILLGVGPRSPLATVIGAPPRGLPVLWPIPRTIEMTTATATPDPAQLRRRPQVDRSCLQAFMENSRRPAFASS